MNRSRELYRRTFKIFQLIFLLFPASCTKSTNTDNIQENSIVNSTIVYTDIVPDAIYNSCAQTSCSQTYHLDLNNDKIIDFDINVFFKPGIISERGITITALNKNSIATDVKLPLAMNANDPVAANLSWYSGKQILRTYTHIFSLDGPPNVHWNGNWSVNADRYVGLQITAGTNTYYGWVRLNAQVSSTNSTLVVKDYGFNRSTGQAILAGQIK